MNEQTAKSEDDTAPSAPSAASNRGKLSEYLAHVERGDKAHEDKDIATAITEFQAAALMRPNMFHPQMMLGKLLYEQGMHEEAIGFLKSAHEMQPNNIILLLHIAELLALIGDSEGAQGVICEALAVDDKNVTAVCMLGQLLIMDQKYDEAINLLQAAIEETPDEAEFWRSIGDVMIAKSDKENAKIFYGEALRLNPSLEAAEEGLAKAENRDKEEAAALN